jgi:hypothetical protein
MPPARDFPCVLRFPIWWCSRFNRSSLTRWLQRLGARSAHQRRSLARRPYLGWCIGARIRLTPDSRIAIEKLVELAKREGVRLAKRAAIGRGRYTRAHQFNRSRRLEVVQRSIRCICREVECILRGKARSPYEFGCKVSIATLATAPKGGQFALHAKALHGNPYDGHTPSVRAPPISKSSQVSRAVASMARGLSRHNYPGSRSRSAASPSRHQGHAPRDTPSCAMEPVIDHRMSRNHLKGQGSPRRPHQCDARRCRLQPQPAPVLIRAALAVAAPFGAFLSAPPARRIRRVSEIGRSSWGSPLYPGADSEQSASARLASSASPGERFKVNARSSSPLHSVYCLS